LDLIEDSQSNPITGISATNLDVKKVVNINYFPFYSGRVTRDMYKETQG
jgi:hypothetical protein